MQSFSFATAPIDTETERRRVVDPACGGYASFEGWVRDHNEGQQVRRLEYEAFEQLACREGERILAEAVARFGVEHVACVHRIGDLQLGDLAVWVGASARHRAEAFWRAATSSTRSSTACRSGRRSTTSTAIRAG